MGKVARHMVRHLDSYLSATQLGITLASLALGWIGEPAFAWIVRPVVDLFPGAGEEAVRHASVIVAFLIITILHIVLGELAPKSLAIRKPEATSLWIAIPLFAFYKVTYPAIWVLNHSANAILRIFGIQPVSEHELGHDEEELRRLLAASHPESLSEEKQELLDNIFELSHRTARQIMVPRGDVVYLSTSRPFEANLEIARRSGHTRFPLCEGDLDRILGLIHIKDLFRTVGPPPALTETARELTFVPETLGLDRLLLRLRQGRVHMAAVLDEYGGVSGIVTLENVVEEIVGAIQDEFDAEEPELVPVGEGVFDASGSMLVRDFEDELGLELSDRDEDTIAGLVLSELGRSPEVADRVTIGPVEAEIREVNGNRIVRLRVRVNQDVRGGRAGA
jgi:CBS domain containing-hemolysin-like protein